MKNVALFLVLLVTSPASGSSLFDDDSILEVTLSGPISSLIKQKRSREEFLFSFAVEGATTDVAVRVRGKSRVTVCPFPPLRLDFAVSRQARTPFAGESKLKLVTHCRNGSQKLQDSVLNEFLAYRLFNLISDRSFRVRLLRIHYEDSDGNQKRLDRAHYGFLIESDEGLARRFGGQVASVDAVHFSSLDIQQAARLQVFQYLVGNKDWSFVKANDGDSCCHNIDLLDIDGTLVPVPYDFDLAALARTSYPARYDLNQSTRRSYSGYCRTSLDTLDRAIDHIQQLKSKLLATALQVPALDNDTRDHRTTFTATYFDEAADKAALLEKFRRNCIGRR